MEKERFFALIVDPSPEDVAQTREYLMQSDDFEIAGVFSGGREALEFMKKTPVDVVFLELRLPNEFGEDFLRAVIRDELDTEVVILTAETNGDTLRKALSLGAADYVIKPTTKARFEESLRGCKERILLRKGLRTVDQDTVDFLLHFTQNSVVQGAVSKKAADILRLLRKEPHKSFTVKEMSTILSLSSVTVRRYLKQLTDAGQAVCEIDYNTGGHPATVYRLP